jgi:putative spermidine/putrescine transport system permease protein
VVEEVSFAELAGGNEVQLLTEPAPSLPHGTRRRVRKPQAWRGSILVLMAVFFLVPLLCSIKFSLINSAGKYSFSNYTEILSNGALRGALILSLEIAAITSALVVLLVLPTAVLVRIKLPKMQIVMEVVTILPLVVPPIVMAAGLSDMQASAPLWLVQLFFNHPLTCLTPIYTILALPLVYRAVDNGLRAIDLHTLVDASRSLGSSWTSTMVRVILPNVQTAVLGGMFLTICMVLGEVVIAATMLYNTFPNEMILVQQQDNAPGIPVAETLVAALFQFFLLFSLTYLARRRGASSTRVI